MSLDCRIHVEAGDLDLQVDVRVESTEVVAVLGPNGAGKTTLLRALAGLAPLRAGRIALDGVLLDDVDGGVCVAPERRNIGFVFQDYLLFPHLSVLDNVAFGLRSRGHPRREAQRRARAWIERLSLSRYADAKPAALSGGQAQRVALARALALEPAMLLLDEPLSALDVGTRAEVRRDLRQHLESFAGMRVLVTHDPIEARALATRLVILEHGRIVQHGTADEVTGQPRSAYVADLAGVNLLRGCASGDRVVLDRGGVLTAPAAGSGDVFVVIHPRAVALHRSAPEGTPRNVWQGTVSELDDEGPRVRVRVSGIVPIVAEVTAAAVADLALARGAPVWVSVKATEVATYPA